MIDTGEGGMVKSSEQISLKDKAFPFFFIRIDHFFESKDILPYALISYLVNGSKSPFAQQFFHQVTSTHNASQRESCLYFLHYAPQRLELSFRILKSLFT